MLQQFFHSVWMADTVASSQAEGAIETVQNKVEEVTTFWENIWKWFCDNWLNFVICAFILVVGWLLSNLLIRLMKRGMKRSNLDLSAVSFLCSIAKYFLRFLVIIISLYPFGVSIATVFAALGAAGLGLSLGLKESVANFASGIQIVITKPFSAGDYIAINNVEGTVQRVEIMYTTLKTLEHHEVVIPNATLTAGTITNYTAMGVRRATMNFSLRYGENIPKVRKVILEICDQHPLVLKDPAPIFVVQEQAADGISVSLRVYSAPENYWKVFWEINEQVADCLYQKGIQVPFNQLDVHIRQDDTK